MPPVLCPEGQVWDQLPGSNCVSCTSCTEYADSPWCSSCFLGTGTPATLKEDLSWLWAIVVTIAVSLLVIAGVTFYCWRKIGQKHGDPRPGTVQTRVVNETGTMTARLVPTGS
ncbi:uncharacterized protein LOC144878507 [Branchiostoma floridae x Branchiostoma japonicum]